MRKTLIIGSVLMAFLGMTSCVKDSFDPLLCLQKIRIEPRWINTEPLDEDESIPITVVSGSGETMNYLSDINGVDVELLPGVYQIVGAEKANNVSVDGTTVTIATEADGTATQPGVFSGGATTGEVKPNTVFQIIPLPMRQQTRQLIVQLKFSGEGVSYLNRVEGTINGITIARHIDKGFLPADSVPHPAAIENGLINYTFIKDDSGMFSGANNLLGVDGSTTQTLNLEATTSLGTVIDFSLNVTDDLFEFHTTDVEQPWYIILELEVNTKLEMDIIDWYSGTESNIIAQ